MCVTVWKTYNNVCYVIPFKYYGLLKPSDNYILTTNMSDLDILLSAEPKTIIVAKDDETVIVNNSKKKILIIDYDSRKKYFDSLYTYFDRQYSRYKKQTIYIQLHVKENYATDNNGRKL